MLENLNKINWSKLKHAYGNAQDVPFLIETLLSGDKDEREDAMIMLQSNIYHQGTIYEATAYAIPFLIELLNSETVQDRDAIFWNLGLIYGGYYTDDYSVCAKQKIRNQIFIILEYFNANMKYDVKVQNRLDLMPEFKELISR